MLRITDCWRLSPKNLYHPPPEPPLPHTTSSSTTTSTTTTTITTTSTTITTRFREHQMGGGRKNVRGRCSRGELWEWGLLHLTRSLYTWTLHSSCGYLHETYTLSPLTFYKGGRNPGSSSTLWRVIVSQQLLGQSCSLWFVVHVLGKNLPPTFM